MATRLRSREPEQAIPSIVAQRRDPGSAGVAHEAPAAVFHRRAEAAAFTNGDLISDTHLLALPILTIGLLAGFSGVASECPNAGECVDENADADTRRYSVIRPLCFHSI